MPDFTQGKGASLGQAKQVVMMGIAVVVVINV